MCRSPLDSGEFGAMRHRPAKRLVNAVEPGFERSAAIQRRSLNPLPSDAGPPRPRWGDRRPFATSGPVHPARASICEQHTPRLNSTDVILLLAQKQGFTLSWRQAIGPSGLRKPVVVDSHSVRLHPVPPAGRPPPIYLWRSTLLITAARKLPADEARLTPRRNSSASWCTKSQVAGGSHKGSPYPTSVEPFGGARFLRRQTGRIEFGTPAGGLPARRTGPAKRPPESVGGEL